MVKLIYGDTDSLLISNLKDKQQGYEIEERLNNVLKKYAKTEGCINNYLEIEFEAFATVALMVKKKRYAMRLDDGTNKIMGMQMKRSDVQPLARRLQETVINYILDGAKAPEVIEWYNKQRDAALNGSYDTELGIPRKFVKDLDEYANNYAIEGARYSNEILGKHFGAGDKAVIYHIKHTDGGLYPGTDSIALEYEEEIPDGFSIDRKRHWARVEKALLPLLNDANLLQREKQTSLGDFL